MGTKLKFYTILLLTIVILGGGKSVYAQQKRQIIINYADSMRNLKLNGNDVRRLLGNVSIRHDETTITCDSLYDYVGQNKFDAFSNVKVFQKNSTLYGDTLMFNGGTKRGKVRGKVVKLVDEEVTLETRFLDFETVNNTADYFGGAVISHIDFKFSSERGKYFSKEKMFAASGQVAFADEDILINTDSLEYYTETELAKFYGPTRIYNEENYLYSERGQHNRETQESEFHVNAFIDNGEQKLYGDNIFYDRAQGKATIEGNGLIVDTTHSINIYGQLLKYDEQTDFAEVPKEPLAIYISDESDTLYLRANKLSGISFKDSVHTDSTLYNLLIGEGDVRFFRNDLQGVCDSMSFHSVDSILYLHKSPVLWNDENQLTADKVNIQFKNKNIHRMEFSGSSFVVAQEDSTRFNQIKGREMVGFFNQGKLTRLDVNGNGETVYFARDKGEIVGVNKAVSSNLSIGINQNKISSIMFRDSPVATLYPIEKVELQDVMLTGFAWHIDKRPGSPIDIIPQGLDINFYTSIHQKATKYRSEKRNPAQSLNELAGKVELKRLDPFERITPKKDNGHQLQKINTRLR